MTELVLTYGDIQMHIDGALLLGLGLFVLIFMLAILTTVRHAIDTWASVQKPQIAPAPFPEQENVGQAFVGPA